VQLHPIRDLGALRFLERVGGGALGESFLAGRRDRIGTPELVVKVLHPHLVDHEEARAIFDHEARILAVMDHPSIPGFRGSGSVDGRPYVATAWVPGFDLASWLGSRHRNDVAGVRRAVPIRLPLAAALDLGAQLADLLQHVHDRRDIDGTALHVVHRDVAPDNVRLAPDGRVYLLDFGVAWSRWLPPACREGVRGTPRYMAPEQVRGEPPDRRADVYALGALLFEALSGRRLRTGELPGLLVDAADREAPPLHGLEPDLPPEVCAVVDGALTLDVAERTGTAGEVGDALRRAATFVGLPTPGDGAALARSVAEGVPAA